jgi:hypothetical protein
MFGFGGSVFGVRCSGFREHLVKPSLRAKRSNPPFLFYLLQGNITMKKEYRKERKSACGGHRKGRKATINFKFTLCIHCDGNRRLPCVLCDTMFFP